VAFGAFAGVSLGLVALPYRPVAIVAAIVGVVAVGCSGRLYVVRGRPAWNTPLTIVSFMCSGIAAGPLLAMTTSTPTVLLRALAAIGIVGQLVTLGLQMARLRNDPAREWFGSYRLLTGLFRSHLMVRVGLAVVGLGFAVAGAPAIGLAAVVVSEIIGRYLFYVTVVPLSAPGTFGGER
jgi:formate dehydrogenase iron-sulfur subunit